MTPGAAARAISLLSALIKVRPDDTQAGTPWVWVRQIRDDQ
ncbi:hypothetical protein SBI_05714 [Streptomyces bingchenggensis BCW-1]|uniref:Uncharacterized protein n=1 Tax=Streptomyces bingchenggensis (strain BCW-1) TaxID=749414 RepID=D7CED8_STRBB|nr:hypothetical protein SBI_05714 [Streptomyces bingchenggensis BCW-1]